MVIVVCIHWYHINVKECCRILTFFSQVHPTNKAAVTGFPNQQKHDRLIRFSAGFLVLCGLSV